jgi:hypothetical protein
VFVRVSALLGAVLATACYSGANANGSGDPDTATDGASAGEEAGEGEESSSGDDDGEPSDECASPQRRLALLSNRRYGNAVRDLLDLAEAPVVSSGGGTHDTLLPAGPKQVGDPLAFEYNGIAHAAAAQADLAAIAPCAAGEDELACASAFVDDFGARAFRRPLNADERDGLLAVYDVGREQDGDYAGGIRLVIATVLQAPTFLYISELGEEDDDGFALTPWEVAAQLSFFLLDSVPDEGLREAAADGRLADAEGIEAEVDRLLASPEVQAGITSIYLRWLGSARVLGAEKEAPEFTDELRASMNEETSRFMDDLIWTDAGNIEQMFTASTTWVDAPLAEFYGLPAPAGEGFVEVDLPPERMGVLTHASLLASLSGVSETSVVYRGLFVARDLLCMKFDPPPEGAANTPLDGIEGERALSEYRMSTSPCSGCHVQFDPFGLLFENYDELGRHRTMIDDAPVDASADIVWPEAVSGNSANILEVAPGLAGAEEIAACATQRVAGYAVQRTIDDDLECRVDELTAAFIDADTDLVELVRLIATSRLMRTRGGQP